MRMPAHRGLHEETGFTLIELVVAMPLMLIVVGGMTLVLTTLTNYNSQNQESLTLQTEARSAINRMETEIRGAFYGDGVTTPISAATATSITFTTPDEYAATVSGSTLASFHLLRVSYQLSSKLLQRQFQTSGNTYPSAPPWTGWSTMSAWTTVVGSSGSVTNSDVFSYYDQNNCQSSTPTAMAFPIAATSLGSIACVKVKLTLSTVGGSGAMPDSFTVTDLITIRGTSD